jgi:Xaa-Pro aminopeptidase
VDRARRLARLLNILAAVVAEPGLNPIELAQRVGVSERTLRRDLAQLRDMGYEVEYSSGYEVQEKLNLDGRGGRRGAARGSEPQLELLQAVAQALGKINLGGDLAAPAARGRGGRSRPAAIGPAPLVLIAGGEQDADFLYATGFAVESGLYIRFAGGDDLLVTSPLEVDRARAQSRAKAVMVDAAAAPRREWARLAAGMLKDRGLERARVSPRLHAAQLEDLRAGGIEAEIDRQLFVAERRRKTTDEAAMIRAAQEAAESAVSAVARRIAQADIKDGVLWDGGKPLTSEQLYAQAQLLLGELGFTCPDMIIAGSPDNAMPHYRGQGAIGAGMPVIIDIFPTGRAGHYHGDLTRTVVAGEISDEVRRMHAAVLQALDAGTESIRAGVPGEEVHETVCQVLVDRGYGTTTTGFEGPDGVAKMNHSTGHGVGLDVHEEPSLRGAEPNELHAGDVVTVEPGLYLLGFGGVRIEDTGMVTADGFQNFTTITRSLDPRDY